jgi:hypothetical protein
MRSFCPHLGQWILRPAPSSGALRVFLQVVQAKRIIDYPGIRTTTGTRPNLPKSATFDDRLIMGVLPFQSLRWFLRCRRFPSVFRLHEYLAWKSLVQCHTKGTDGNKSVQSILLYDPLLATMYNGVSLFVSVRLPFGEFRHCPHTLG